MAEPRTTTINDIDERLLAGRLREQKEAAKREEAIEEPATGEQPQSLRQKVFAARQALDLKEKAKEKIEEKITAPARSGTGWLLKAAWLNLIPSFGLTLIYINIHVFLRWVIGEKLFCKLGDEWVPKQAKAIAGEAGKLGGRAIGIVEVMGLLICDLVVLSIILILVTIIIILVDVIAHPISTAWGWLGDAFKAILNI